jgi:hypothetical protein
MDHLDAYEEEGIDEEYVEGMGYEEAQARALCWHCCGRQLDSRPHHQPADQACPCTDPPWR